jgi:DNA-binding GntR family transcriptional regulator
LTSDILPAVGTLDIAKEYLLTTVLKTELERLIFDGKIKVGERIDESNLAAHFKTSRGPLREALQAPGEQGLISFARNRGAFVRRMRKAGQTTARRKSP